MRRNETALRPWLSDAGRHGLRALTLATLASMSLLVHASGASPAPAADAMATRGFIVKLSSSRGATVQGAIQAGATR